MRKIFLIIIGSSITMACSQFSQSPTSKAWHNLNAKYNALLIARDNYKYAKQVIYYTTKENYSAMLPVLLPLDSVKAQPVLPNLKETIKNTSLIAERHSNSRFLDDAYLLLGQARLEKEDYINAIEVFKYVNTTGKNENVKHTALISLMRAYTEQKDFGSALQVAEILRMQELNKQNTIDFYLTKAYLHQLNDEIDISAAILDEALKLMPKKEFTARTHYVAGQMYDLLGKPDLAMSHFEEVLSNRPSYDMEFYATMNGLMSEAAVTKSSAGAVQNEFKNMLTDRKNADLKDKIYFTMGRLEEDKNNYPKAIEFLQASAKSSTANSNQKPYTYLELANIYYDKLQDYVNASAYYDSTLTILPKTSSDYDKIAGKALSLGDFIRYKKVITLEDSLQKLAQMNPLALDKTLDNIIEQRKIEEQKLQEMAQKIANQNNANNSVINEREGIKRWELYDPVAIAKGKTDFILAWGSRPLEDNWRRKDKEAGQFGFKIERGIVDANEPASKPKNAREEERKKADELAKQKNDAEKQELLKKIPTTPEALIASKRKQEEAYYQLGKIYKLQFNEPENAKTTFVTLLNRFPTTQYESEVLYFLTLMDDNQATSQYRTSLINKYPSSTYARQLQRGKVEITSDLESKSQTDYAQIYDKYSSENYDEALKMADDGLITYTGTSIEDKYAMLRILLLAKTGKVDLYKQALTDFVQSYPTSQLLSKVNALKSSLK